MDEIKILLALGGHLEQEELEGLLTSEIASIVKTARNGIACMNIAKKWYPDIVLADTALAQLDGYSVCEQLRSSDEFENALIILISDEENYETAELKAFRCGADEFLKSPLNYDVLLHRINRLLLRTSKYRQNSKMKLGNLIIDQESFTVTIDGKETILPKKEFELLSLLVANNGKVCRREKIFSKVWGNGITSDERTIDVHIRRLRKYLGNEHIKTIKGVGYKLEI